MISDIFISKPYVKVFDQKVRLCSDITENNQTKTLYFEFDLEYKNFLVTDRADCFLLALLNNAMNLGKNIVSEIGISKELLFQLSTYYIPVVAKQMPDLNKIEIKALPLEPLETNGLAVGTGNSGGVDSFYTLIKYNKEELGSFRLTHVLFNNISTADNNDDRIKSLFEKDKKEKLIIAEKLGLKQINIYTNLYSFYHSQFIFNYYFTAQYASPVYALGKLFSVYYYSSGVSVADFSMNHDKIKDAAYYDIFTLDCISSKYLKFYSSGSEVGRLEKTQYIASNPVVQNHLQVCAVEQSSYYYENNSSLLNKLNCGKCGKCLRTISTLYGLDCLDKFSEVFDLNYFYKHKSMFLGEELASDGHTFLEEIIPLLKNKNKLSNFSYIWLYYFKFRRIISHIPVLVKIYRKLKKFIKF